SPRRGPALFFAAAAVLAALPPLLLPRLPVCSLWAAALCVTGLAAMGWDGLARGRYAPRSVAKILGGFAAVAALGTGLAFWRYRSAPEAGMMLGLLAASIGILTRL